MHTHLRISDTYTHPHTHADTHLHTFSSVTILSLTTHCLGCVRECGTWCGEASQSAHARVCKTPPVTSQGTFSCPCAGTSVLRMGGHCRLFPWHLCPPPLHVLAVVGPSRLRVGCHANRSPSRCPSDPVPTPVLPHGRVARQLPHTHTHGHICSAIALLSHSHMVPCVDTLSALDNVLPLHCVVMQLPPLAQRHAPPSLADW